MSSGESHVVITLGKIAFDHYFKICRTQGRAMPTPVPKFGHGVVYRLPWGVTLLGSYHPSQQNTFTGKLTRSMFHAVFRKREKKSIVHSLSESPPDTRLGRVPFICSISEHVWSGVNIRRTGAYPRRRQLLLSFRLPVVQELLQPSIGQWVFEERLKHAIGHRADVTACQGRLDDMLGMTNAGH